MKEGEGEIRFSRMNSMKGIRSEMVRVYREARTGKLAIDDASKLVYMLKHIADVLRDTDLERRLAEIEGKARPERIGMRGLSELKRAA